MLFSGIRLLLVSRSRVGNKIFTIGACIERGEGVVCLREKFRKNKRGEVIGMGDEQKGVPQSVEEMTGDFPGRKRQELPPELQPKSKMEYKPTMGGWQGFNIPKVREIKSDCPCLSSFLNSSWETFFQCYLSRRKVKMHLSI